MSLGERIKEQRKTSGLSQEKVAELIGVSRQAVTKWETGASAPSTENLFKLAEIFGTTVDMLLASEKEAEKADDKTEKGSLAEQIYHLYRAEEEKKAMEQKEKRKTNFLFFLSIIGGYIIIYLLGRVFARTGEEPATMLYWLIRNNPGDFSYLYGWLLHNNLFWVSMALSALPALFGKKKLSFSSLSGFAIGLMLGELCGKNPSGFSYGFGHYGWAIWGCIFAFSMIMGAILEKLTNGGFDIRSKKLHIWAAVFIIGIIAIILFVRLNMPTFA